MKNYLRYLKINAIVILKWTCWEFPWKKNSFIWRCRRRAYPGVCGISHGYSKNNKKMVFLRKIHEVSQEEKGVLHEQKGSW